MTESTIRYALYFAPPQDNPWWSLLSRWLGYDACTGKDVPQLDIAAVRSSDFRAITEHPRHYGAHATLKAPFRLSPAHSEQNLLEAVDIYAAGLTAFTLPEPRVELLKNFIALVPSKADAQINRIADDCTVKFDHFRAPLSDAEMARRLGEPLDELSRELLSRWGYPHVLQRYQFHISLTGSLNTYSQGATSAVLQTANEFFAPLKSVELPFNAVCIFRQHSAAQRFTLIHRAGMTS
jgi:putative phosphonate metabolism protein